MKERKKERHLRQWKNESCLRWESNPRHSALRTDSLHVCFKIELSLEVDAVTLLGQTRHNIFFIFVLFDEHNSIKMNTYAYMQLTPLQLT